MFGAMLTTERTECFQKLCLTAGVSAGYCFIRLHIDFSINVIAHTIEGTNPTGILTIAYATVIELVASLSVE
jgi:hypothetical protein